jgi:hypothetical protein
VNDVTVAIIDIGILGTDGVPEKETSVERRDFAVGD